MSLNVGVLGHVDSGKTTLTRVLADTASTASFDKHAEKGGRYNTIDLGFSSLTVLGRRLVLIDCPGHAGLVKAVLAASNVFDMAMLVVDASYGVQLQTAEHLLLCSILCPRNIIIVLNKIDLVPENQINTIIKKLRKTLKSVGIPEDSQVVPISLLHPSENIVHPLISALEQVLFEPQRTNTSELVVAVDHCFPIKGKGTVMTGTVIDGRIHLNQEIEIPHLKEKKKVKGLQCWKQEVNEVFQGERVAVLVSGVSVNNISRTMICAPGVLQKVNFALCSVSIISFYRSIVPSGVKLHISIGFETVMAQCQFLRPCVLNQPNTEYEQLQSLESPCFCFLSFEKPVYTRISSFYIASKLDHQGRGCRFIFHGRLDELIENCGNMRRFVRMRRKGVVERIENERSVICNSLFKRESNITIFEGMPVVLSTGEVGRIESSFGKGGKVRITMVSPLKMETVAQVTTGSLIEVKLFLKKYIDDKSFKGYIPDGSFM